MLTYLSNLRNITFFSLACGFITLGVLHAEDDSSIEMRKNTACALFNQTKGATGATGATGAQGATGARGAQGATGAAAVIHTAYSSGVSRTQTITTTSSLFNLSNIFPPVDITHVGGNYKINTTGIYTTSLAVVISDPSNFPLPNLDAFILVEILINNSSVLNFSKTIIAEILSPNSTTDIISPSINFPYTQGDVVSVRATLRNSVIEEATVSAICSLSLTKISQP